MAHKHSVARPAIVVIVAAALLLVALPDNAKQWAPEFLRKPSIHLGLDLAGGTQLDFRISEQELEQQKAAILLEIDTLERTGENADRLALLQLQLRTIEEQQRTIVEAIRTVLERRINAMGVSETSITPSYVGNEKHLLVQCPGVVDVQECIEIVGKTIQLEFKEEFVEATEEHTAKVREDAAQAYRRITQSGETLAVVGEDYSNILGVMYDSDARFFESELPATLQPLWNAAEDNIVYAEGTLRVPMEQEDGSMAEEDIPGIYIAERIGPITQTGRTINNAQIAFNVLDAESDEMKHESHENIVLDTNVPVRVISTLRSMQPGDLMATEELEDGTARVLFLRSYTAGTETMAASHILIAYEGALSAEADITRTKEEALALAQDVRQQLETGADFVELATRYSSGPSAAQGGSLGTFGRGDMVPAFEEAAFTLETGELSEPIETPFGYHIIRSDQAPSAASDTASYEELVISGEESAAQAEEIVAQLWRGDVRKMEEQIPVRMLFFSLLPTGWKDTPLDGKHFRSATVTLDPTSNLPVVQINFTDEGGRMFQELTGRNIGKRIAIFVGGQLVSAPTVQSEISGGSAIITGSRNIREAQELARDLNTGAIPAPIFLSGQRTIEATLGAAALATSLKAALIGIIILMLYMIVIYRFLGLIADIALTLYALLFFTFLKLPLFLFTDNHIVLTLAGMAGIILSIGMAVDANVLIFERIREELKKGKLLKTAVRTGFHGAWPSIRDGNVSTFITCMILFFIGTSIVRGFAITLATGVLLSMFTAIVITRWILTKIAESPIAARTELFGVAQSREENNSF